MFVFPVLLTAIAAGVLVAGSFGVHPLWNEPALTMAEAAALKDLGTLQRLVWSGVSINAPSRVRPGILKSNEITATPLQASVGTRTPFTMQFLLANGARMNASDRAVVTCLAVKDEAPEILEFLDEGGRQPRPDCDDVVTPW